MKQNACCVWRTAGRYPWADENIGYNLGIEVKTDQQTIGHSPPRRQVPRKGKGAR